MSILEDVEHVEGSRELLGIVVLVALERNMVLS